MTAKKDPPGGQPIEPMLEILARQGGELEGLKGEALEAHIERAVAEARRVVEDLDRHVGEEQQRQEVAAEMSQLLDMLIRSGTESAKAIEPYRQPLINAFHNAELQQLAAGMQQLMEWMVNPTPETEAKAKVLLAQLEKSAGPAWGLDPEAADAARRERIDREVRESLDKAFRGKDFAAALKKKPT